MGWFYGALKIFDPADALFQSRRAFILGQETLEVKGASTRPLPAYTHPFYWAPFVLIEGRAPGLGGG